MNEHCYIEYCPGSPKFCSRSFPDLFFCEEHKMSPISSNSQVSPLDRLPLAEVKSKSLAIKELAHLSNTVSDLMLTGKGMFKEICNKLCTITAEISKRQQDLIQIFQNVSNCEKTPDEITKLADLNIKLRNKEDFAKLIDQHFSTNDSNIDFSLFTEDFNCIREEVFKGNKIIELIKYEAEKDRQDRQSIRKIIERIEEKLKNNEKAFDEKIRTTEKKTFNRENNFVKCEDLKRVEEKVESFVELLNLNEHEVKLVNIKCDNVNEGIYQQKIELQTAEKRISDTFNLLKSKYEAFTKEIELNVDKFQQRSIETISEYERNRDVYNETIVESISNDFKLKLDKNFKEVEKIKRGLVAGVEESIHSLKLKIREFDDCFMIKTRLEIDGYSIAIAKELRLMAIEDEISAKLRKVFKLKEERKLAVEQEKLRLEYKRQEKERIEKESREFNLIPIQQKRLKFESLNIPHYQKNFTGKYFEDSKEIRVSHDGKYGFVCKFQLGIFKQIVSFNKVFDKKTVTDVKVPKTLDSRNY